jgi:hypothetical protein
MHLFVFFTRNYSWCSFITDRSVVVKLISSTETVCHSAIIADADSPEVVKQISNTETVCHSVIIADADSPNGRKLLHSHGSESSHCGLLGCHIVLFWSWIPTFGSIIPLLSAVLKVI